MYTSFGDWRATGTKDPIQYRPLPREYGSPYKPEGSMSGHHQCDAEIVGPVSWREPSWRLRCWMGKINGAPVP